MLLSLPWKMIHGKFENILFCFVLFWDGRFFGREETNVTLICKIVPPPKKKKKKKSNLYIAQKLKGHSRLVGFE